MRSVLQRIATGPELSKDITRAEARDAMRLVLDGAVDPVQAGVFLIALRMKRETDDETCGILDAVIAATHHVVAPVDELVDIADPYDGYNRSLPVAAFLPALLAACGVAAVSHGVETLGPKYGVTHHQVLHAAGVRIDLSLDQAAARLADRDAGWAYLDQRTFCPKLHDLIALRDLIVKRPTLTTVEGLARPIRALTQTHLFTGYVHKAYPRIYTLLARAAGYDSALVVRGVEGGVIPSLRQAGKALCYRDQGSETEQTFAPADFGFDSGIQAPPIPDALKPASDAEDAAIDTAVVAHATAEAGMRALDGAPGAARDNLIAAAAVCLWHLGKQPTLRAAAEAVRAVLDSGAARRRLGI